MADSTNTVYDFFNKSLSFFDVESNRIFVAIGIFILFLVLRKLFSFFIFKYIKKLTAKTKTTLDDTLMDLLHPPINFTIVLIGAWLAIQILQLPESVDIRLVSLLQYLVVLVFCYMLYKSATFITTALERFTKRTQTELDDILVPYLKKVFQITAVLMALFKTAEVFLGLTAAAFFGILGGMGLTLGLVFKDIIANWFGCGVIYIDNLFREGDWVQLDAGNIVDADVEEIGLRSTKFRNFDKTISVVPNATIANAVVKNWSKMYKRRVKYNFTLDGVQAEKMQQVLDGIRNILQNDADVHQEFHMVNFRGLEGNARIIRLYYFTKTIVWKEHEKVRENINLKILELFEELGIDDLAYTVVDMSEDKPHN